MTTALTLVIAPSGEMSLRVMEKLEDYQQAVAEGRTFIEAVPVLSGLMFVDEEGQFKNSRYNKVATTLARSALSIAGHDTIVGAAVVVGPPTEDGEETNIKMQTIEAAVNAGGTWAHPEDFEALKRGQ